MAPEKHTYKSPLSDIPKKYAPIKRVKNILRGYSDTYIRACISRGEGTGPGPELIRAAAKIVAEEIKKEMDAVTSITVNNQ